MAFGFGEYWAAIITLVIVMLTLTALSQFQSRLNTTELMVFKIGFQKDENTLEAIEEEFSKMNFKFKRQQLRKRGLEIDVTYEIHVPYNKINALNAVLINNPAIKSFDT